VPFYSPGVDFEALASDLAARVAVAVVEQLAERVETPTPWLDVPGDLQGLVLLQQAVGSEPHGSIHMTATDT
jgi:hypothetical protein